MNLHSTDEINHKQARDVRAICLLPGPAKLNRGPEVVAILRFLEMLNC